MATVDRINIDAGRLDWAIRRAGLTVDDYMQSHPNVAVSSWMEGTKVPTIKQLEHFAKTVHVPFGFLFMDTIPQENIPFPLYRGEAGRYDHFDLNVYDTVNTVQHRQDWLEDYLVDNEIDTCKIVKSVTLRTPVAETVSKLRDALRLDAKWAFSLATTEIAVSKMTEMLEQAGFFVAYNGVVGNDTHRLLKVSECRGFALVSPIAPYIFVNSGDAPTAQLFTLVHETVHLMLGISAGHADTDYSLSHDAHENYCDRVAAEFLVPVQVLRKVWNGDIKKIAKKFCVSELVVARRAHDAGLLSDRDYREFWMEYSHRPVSQKKQSNGGSFYRSSVKRVGRLFAIHVKNALVSRQLSYTDAYRLTGLYGKTFTQFMNDHV
jgi:Zn-dependent peptidase ImmA (M78 family)